FFEVKDETTIKNINHFHDDQTVASKTASQTVLDSSTKDEMSQVREENQKLNHKLSMVLKDYKSLQVHFKDFFQQQEVIKSSEKLTPDQELAGDGNELISLSLGTLSSYKHKSDGPKKMNSFNKRKQDTDDDDQELKLGLGCEFEPTTTVVDDSNKVKKDERKQTVEPMVHGLKTERSDDNELLDQLPLKKARVSVKVVCNTQTMNDGCQWRKYGQKIAKGNPCPRAYYRCTLSPSCPVRKHVQRCAEDKSILITTYEGTHNHPLSVSATAMASTTSAAASMLKSTSSTSQLGLTTTAPFTTTATSTTTFSSHHGTSYNSIAHQYPFYLPKTTISTYQSHPTITLDLTSNPHFSRSNSSTFTMTPRYSSSTCLNFSSPSSSLSSSFESNYKNISIPFTYHGKQTPSHDILKNMSSSASQQQSADTIAAATKALTSNPSFRTALAASITSLVRNVGGGSKI
ncbi:hypothetical protein M8C21_015214, partial [Ambrosia artemisiifolia]